MSAPEAPSTTRRRGRTTDSREVTPGERLLEVDDLRVEFHTDAGVVRAVNGVTFSVAAGETLAVVGESGSGKSVTGMSLLRLLPEPEAHVSGRAVWRGEDINEMREDRIRQVRGGEISMVFQDSLTALNPVMTVGRQISESIRLHLRVGKKEARERAIDALDAVGIAQAADRYSRYPHEFSGGMRQRAMIAMAISCDPQLIIADEPTTALDVTVQAQVLDVLAEMKERTGAGMILITHDLGVVADVADRVMVMYAGHQVESAETIELYDRVSHPYTLGLMGSIPTVDPDAPADARLRPILGSPPNLLALPSGCAFHPRCEYAEVPGICSTDEPDLLEVRPGHVSACHFRSELDTRPRRSLEAVAETAGAGLMEAVVAEDGLEDEHVEAIRSSNPSDEPSRSEGPSDEVADEATDAEEVFDD